jgi:hypothetical protein
MEFLHSDTVRKEKEMPTIFQHFSPSFAYETLTRQHPGNDDPN